MRTTVIFGFAVFLTLIAATARGQTISGTATYRERMALPSAAVFEAVLEDVSRADVPAETIARTRAALPAGSPPFAFTIAYDAVQIRPNHRYVVRARILVDEKLLFTTDTGTAVITGGAPTKVLLMMRRPTTGETLATHTGGAVPLEGTYWKVAELDGKGAPTSDATRDAHLQFNNGRVSGSDGCNRLTGSYHRDGNLIRFDQLAGTQRECVDSSGTQALFRAALKNTSQLALSGHRLELLDSSGARLALFAVASQAAPSLPPSGLAGTSWRLVKFQGGDDSTLTPDDREKYTLEFAPNGVLTVRIDCNRGRGTWKSKKPSLLEFGPLALTRAKCPPATLHDQIVKQWGNVRSYVIRDGHLFLALMADGGTYEFEPIEKPKR